MKKAFALAYGLTAYAMFFGTICYAIGFVGGHVVPKSMNTGPAAPLGEALLVNLGILALFAVQHTIMARPAFKAKWTKIMPKHLERSTFVAITSAILCLLFWQWRPLPGVVWDLGGTTAGAVLQGISWAGWAVVFGSSFMIDHFELFGLRQVFAYVRGKEEAPLHFLVRGFYKYVRHPLMVGFLLAFWAAPTMTTGHLAFALTTTGYILFGTWIEERDLVGYLGDKYRAYQKQVPKLIPFIGGSSEPAAPTANAA